MARENPENNKDNKVDELVQNEEWMGPALRGIKSGRALGVKFRQEKISLGEILRKLSTSSLQTFFRRLLLECSSAQLKRVLRNQSCLESLKAAFSEEINKFSVWGTVSKERFLNLMVTFVEIQKSSPFSEETQAEYKKKIIDCLGEFPDKVNQKFVKYANSLFDPLLTKREKEQKIAELSCYVKRLGKPVIKRENALKTFLDIGISEHFSILNHGTSVEPENPLSVFHCFDGLQVRGVATNPVLKIKKTNGKKKYVSTAYALGNGGINKRVSAILDYVRMVKEKYPDRQIVIDLVGYSRGAIEAIWEAKRIYELDPTIKINLFLNDPVVGIIDYWSKEDFERLYDIPPNVQSLIVTQSANEKRPLLEGMEISRFRYDPKQTVVTTFALEGGHKAQHKKPEPNEVGESEEPGPAYKTMKYILSQGLKNGEYISNQELDPNIQFKNKTYFGKNSMSYSSDPEAFEKLPEHLKKLHQTLQSRIDRSLIELNEEGKVGSEEPLNLVKDFKSIYDQERISFEELKTLLFCIKRLNKCAPSLLPKDLNLVDYVLQKFGEKFNQPAVLEEIRLIGRYLKLYGERLELKHDEKIDFDKGHKLYKKLKSERSASLYLGTFGLNFVDRVYNAIEEEGEKNPYVRGAIRTSLNSPNDMKVFTGGQQISEQTSELIKSAKKEVLIQLFKFDPNSDAGKDIIEALIHLNKTNQKKENKIQVKFKVDRVTGLGAGRFIKSCPTPFDWLKEEDGCQYIIHPDSQERVLLDSVEIKTSFHPHSLFNSYHQKLVVVDEKSLMVRGGDVSSDSDYKDKKCPRTETATLLYNECLAKHAAKSFKKRWERRGSNLEFKYTREIQRDDQQDIPVLLLEKNPSSNPIHISLSPLKIAMLKGIEEAECSIKIMTPNLNEKDIVKAILSAVKRGVSVEIVMGRYHNKASESFPGAGGTNEEIVKGMYEALPPELWGRLQVNWPCYNEKVILGTEREKTMHGKAVIIDGRIVIAGSSPLDVQSFYHSAETDVIVESPEIAKKYVEIFQPVFDTGQSVVGLSLLPSFKEEITDEIAKKMDYLSKEPPKFAFWIPSHYNPVRLEKKEYIDCLISQIKEAGTFEDIDEILQKATEVSLENPLARGRMTKEVKTCETGSIKKINAIREAYLCKVGRKVSFSDENERMAPAVPAF